MKSAPPLPISNRYHVLSVDSIDNNESETCMIRAAQPSTPKIRKKKWERRLPTKYVIAADSARSLSVGVEIETAESALRRALKALIDCGATGLFIDTDYVQNNGIATRTLSQPIPVYNVDGTPNEAGAIKEVVTVVLQYSGHKEWGHLRRDETGESGHDPRLHLVRGTQPGNQLADEGSGNDPMPVAVRLLSNKKERGEESNLQG